VVGNITGSANHEMNPETLFIYSESLTRSERYFIFYYLTIANLSTKQPVQKKMSL